MKMKRITAHPVALRVAYIAVAKFGEGGMDQLLVGREIMNAIVKVVDPDEEFGDPYMHIGSKLIEKLKKAGQPIPDPDLVRNLDLSKTQLGYMKKSLVAMGEKVAPESAAPLFALRDAIEAAVDIEYAPSN